MGQMRNDIDSLNIALLNSTVRANAAAVDPAWPGKFDSMIGLMNAIRARVPNNDKLDQLTIGEWRSLDADITNTIDILKYVDGEGINRDMTDMVPTEQFYDFLVAVGEIRDECRRLRLAQGG